MGEKRTDVKKKGGGGYDGIEAPLPRKKSGKAQRETRETSQDNRNRCVKMNNAVIQPSVRCGASEELETPRFSLAPIGPDENGINMNLDREEKIKKNKTKGKDPVRGNGGELKERKTSLCFPPSCKTEHYPCQAFKYAGSFCSRIH